jgi:aspartyl-tRNA(Asn)/glutamyl-tRNA(Gln) amidotransferase subunit A
MQDMPDNAVDLASNIRNDVVKATDVVERYLTAIEEREFDIHAFNLVLADEARARSFCDRWLG